MSPSARHVVVEVDGAHSSAHKRSPLFLDMIDDARIAFDRNGFMAQALRIWRDNTWYWDLTARRWAKGLSE